MWSVEDFQQLNPDKQAFIGTLLDMGATSPALLADACQLLEDRSGPFVMAFGQLPFKIDGDGRCFKVDGWRAGVQVELYFKPVIGAFSGTGTLRLLAPDDSQEGHLARVELTQVFGAIRLWNKRSRLHQAYVNHLTPHGVRIATIGRVEDWMNIPEAEMPLPVRQFVPLTTRAFEGEVARRVFHEFAKALSSFLRAYSLGYLEDLGWDERIYGYFTMLSPGRIAAAGAPLPVVAGLSSHGRDHPSAIPAPARIQQLCSKYVATSDRVLRQLIAMNQLVRRGEPELAIVGCASTVEYFLNEAIPQLSKRAGYSASLGQCWNHAALNFLGQDWTEWLHELGVRRNPFVHGAPPTRLGGSPRRLGVDPDYVRQTLLRAIDLYRTVNLHFGRAYVPPPEAPARLDD